MDVFISWSQDYSREVAKVFKKWIKQVLQLTNPFMSESDIDLGTVPLNEIDNRLRTTRVGIVIVTKENINSPWINYETGAIATTLDGDNKLIPVLIDVTIEELGAVPLSKFQAVRSFSKEEMRKLIISLNNELEEMKLPLDALDETFEMWWPQLENQVGEIKKKRTFDEANSKRRKTIDTHSELGELYYITERNTRVLEDISMRINENMSSNQNSLRFDLINRNLMNTIDYSSKLSMQLNNIQKQLLSLIEREDSNYREELIVILNRLKKLEYEVQEHVIMMKKSKM